MLRKVAPCPTFISFIQSDVFSVWIILQLPYRVYNFNCFAIDFDTWSMYLLGFIDLSFKLDLYYVYITRGLSSCGHHYTYYQTRVIAIMKLLWDLNDIRCLRGDLKFELSRVPIYVHHGNANSIHSLHGCSPVPVPPWIPLWRPWHWRRSGGNPGHGQMTNVWSY